MTKDRQNRHDQGFALIMAVIAALLFSYLALFVVENSRGDIAMARARQDRARMEAAAQAGLMLAIHGLGLDEHSGRWAIDGRPRRLTFDGVTLTIWVEDERGKMPANDATEAQWRRLLAGAGVSGLQLGMLTAAITDWIDDDMDSRPNGAEREDYRRSGSMVFPRDRAIRTLDELLDVRGMTPDILERIRPALTLFFGPPPAFSARTAVSPLAVTAMLGQSEAGVDMVARQRDLANGAQTALDTADSQSLIVRPLCVRVLAELPDGGRVSHAAIIQLTSNPARGVRFRDFQ